MHRQSNRSSGNVLFLILIAVALFAALAFAVSRSSQTSGGNVSQEKADMLASRFLQHMTDLQSRIMRMRMNGVRDYELNFYYNSTSQTVGGANDNTNCTQSRCRVYDPNGGGAVAQKLLELRNSPDIDRQFIFYINVPGNGTSAPDIVYVMGGDVKYDVCMALNRRMGLNSIPTNTTIPTTSDVVMYAYPVPVGPIPDTGQTISVTPAVGSLGTFCACSWEGSNASLCETLDTHGVRFLFHVLVAR